MGVLETKPPTLRPSDAARLAGEVFGLCVAAAHPLPSERDQNFRLREESGRELLLKVANSSEDPAVLDFQNRALRHVAERDPDLPVPRMLAPAAGETCTRVEAPDGRRHALRLLTWLPGRPLGERRASPALLDDLGAALARLGRSLRGFFHPAARHELLWDLAHAGQLRERVGEIDDPRRRDLADAWLRRFECTALPALPGLRAQVIHNDVSLHNTLVDAAGARVAGIVDFGDMVHAPVVQDLAVTLSEVMLDAPDPVAAVARVAGSYHESEPLHDEERALLFELLAARLAMAAVISAWRARRHPENRAYITGDDAALWALLERLEELEPTLRAALLEPLDAAAEPGTKSLLERRRRLLAPTLSHFYEEPLHLVRGRGVWLVDAQGRACLDAYNNVPHVGHGHPAVVEAITRQTQRLVTNTRYLYASIVEYAERLTSTLPTELEVCMFVCSGSEANDLAWRLAKAHTGNGGAVVIAGAYHGTTDAVHALSPCDHPPGLPAPAHVRVVPAPDDYRGPHRRGEPGIGARYAAHLDAATASLRPQGHGVAAFLLDPLLSSSGILVPPEGYLRASFAKVRAAGGVCIADEVQAGFGRTGAQMWGFAAHGVVPDIVTLGKPIGNGYPMAAVVTTRAIAASFGARGEFVSTFGGNPVACAAGLAVLDVIEREGLRESARRVGARMRAGIEALATRHAWIGDVRGAGLFLGVDLVRDRETREPAARETRRVVERMREHGVLIGWDGPHANVLKIRPPLVFGEADAGRLVEALDRSLAAESR